MWARRFMRKYWCGQKKGKRKFFMRTQGGKRRTSLVLLARSPGDYQPRYGDRKGKGKVQCLPSGDGSRLGMQKKVGGQQERRKEQAVQSGRAVT